MSRRLCVVLPELDADTATHFGHTARLLAEVARLVDLEVIVQRGRGRADIPGARRVEVLTSRGKAGRLAELLWRLSAARRHGCRDLHVHYAYSGAIGAALVARLTGARATYWHCGESRQFFPPWRWSRRVLAKKLGDELPFRLALALVHGLVTGTPRMAAYYAREFGVSPERIAVVPNDLDLGRFAAAPDRQGARDRLGVGGRPVVLYVHHLSPRKGAHHLVPIATRVRARVADVVFLVVGDGPAREDLERAAAAGLGTTVRVVGAVPNHAIADYYAAADVFLMPSEEEGFPRVLLEAQAMGVPFVAADVGGVADVITPCQARFLVPRGDVEGLAGGVVELLGDPGLRQALAAEGRANVRQFDVRRVAPRLVAALLDRPRPGAR